MTPFWQMIVWAFSGQISVGSSVVYKYASSSCHSCIEVVLSRGPNLLCSSTVGSYHHGQCTHGFMVQCVIMMSVLCMTEVPPTQFGGWGEHGALSLTTI